MYDFLSVDVFDSVDYSVEEGLNFWGQEGASDSDEFTQGLVLAKLEEYVDILSILKAMIKLDDVGVVQCFVQLDFIGQSQSCSVGA